MAAVAVVAPPKQTSGQPARSMTHPLREPKKDGPKRRGVKKGEPFDPEELSRRLAVHLAEQKAKAERRRARARAAAAEQVYHHVPTVAAIAFERTATATPPVDPSRQMHNKASLPIMTQRMEDLSLAHTDPQLSSLQNAQARDRAVLEQDLLRDRDQSQWTQDMEEAVAVAVDIERGVYKVPQRSFNLDFARKARHQKSLSTGDVFSDDEEPVVTTITPPKLNPVLYAGRNNWAQQDEECHNRKGLVKEKSSPILKNKDSIWILGGKKEKSGKVKNKEQRSRGIGDIDSSPDGLKGVKTSFLARFKRHPS